MYNHGKKTTFYLKRVSSKKWAALESLCILRAGKDKSRMEKIYLWDKVEILISWPVFELRDMILELGIRRWIEEK